ncbi:MAG: FHA domain-containing protein [Gemmataceae bacterium]|nr:FHA domain-containing protein [Gemmataceae bacterium]MCI0740522.1 FHA domain-containing protein [Gemmataceae bacterium]
MGDPRLNGSHLGLTRHDRYDAVVDEMLDDRGSATAQADPLARPPMVPRTPLRRELPPGGTFTLVSLADGRRHPLRVGINSVGRFPENDLVLGERCVSRRHCVVLVHATGGCEVYDTASRNGTWVNRRRVGRVELLPGDVLMLCNHQFLVAWVGPDGELHQPSAGSDTVCHSELSPTG